MLPLTPDIPVLPTLPELAKSANSERTPKTSTVGLGVQSDSQNTGIVVVQAGGVTLAPIPRVIAPPRVSILPSRITPAARPTAPAFDNKVPFISASAATLKAPSAIKKTLQDFAPPVKVIFVAAGTVTAPKNLNIKKASGSPPPSRITFPPKDPALDV